MLPSPNPGRTGFVELEVVDADGREKHSHREPADSYVDNWYQLMALLADANNNVSVDSVAKGAQPITNDIANTWDGNGTGISSHIAIGTDGSSFTQSDNALGNQLNTNSVASRSIETANRLIRTSNSHAINAAKTVKETGIIYRNLQATNATAFDMLVERTALSTTVDVVDGDSVSVTYEQIWSAP